MTVAETIQAIADLTSKNFNGKKIFDDAVRVKNSPHSWPINIYGIEVGPGSGIWLLDNDQKWHRLEAADTNALLIANSILQRIKLLILQSKAS